MRSPINVRTAFNRTAMISLLTSLLIQGQGVAQEPEKVEELPQRVLQVSTSVLQQLNAGQPTDVLVLLDSTPEEVSMRTITAGASPAKLDRGEYGRYVAEKVRLLDQLKSQVFTQIGHQGIDRLTDFDVLPVAHVRISNPAALERLTNHPRVRSIDEIRASTLFLSQSLPLIQQPQAASRGANGQGTTVCVLDTGTDYTQAAFGSCSAPGTPGCKVVYAADTAPDDGYRDAHGHGTNVSAIVLGTAPGTLIADLDVFDGEYAYSNHIISAINWCIANRATYNISSINMSLGGGRYYAPVAPTDTFGTVLQNALNAGIAVVVASGNETYTDSIAWPAAYSNAISVGAVYDSNIGPIGWSGCYDSTTAADKVTCFSNSASFLTLLAPGALINAANITMGGTSQAAPHVAGAVAVLHQRYPNESVGQLTMRLLAASKVTDHRNGIAKPRLNLVQSIDYGATSPEQPDPELPPPQPGSARPSQGAWRHAIR